jgi:diguanylate cyclase
MKRELDMRYESPTLTRLGSLDPRKVGIEADAELLRSARVMMVDDEPITLEVVQAFLEEAGYQNFILTSESANAMNVLAAERPDVVLLDLMMPQVSGFDILKAMRADATFRHIPVIVLTSSTDAETKLKALALGATDYLAKPVDASELTSRLRNTLAAKAYVDRIMYFDTLTGLHNRQMFVDHLDWTLRQAKRYGHTGALLHINIDRFKKINDALGPALGDELLKDAAKRFDKCIRVSDTLGQLDEDKSLPRLSRLGSDEFGVLLGQLDKTEGAAIFAQRVHESMAAPFEIGGREVFMTCSIGITIFPVDGKDRNTLLQQAAVALGVAKERGGNTHCYFSKDLNDRSLQYLRLHSELRKAIDGKEFQLFFPPKIDTRTRQLIGAEALLRWNHPERGLVAPGEFIPFAEETGLIVPIGAWVFEEACRQITTWQAAGLEPVRISVNISGRQFGESDFLTTIRDTLKQFAVDPGYLQIELTESILMENAAESIQILQQLKELGLKLSIDDFGTGYSSLSYLGRLPLDELKIDRSFLTAIGDKTSEKSAPIVVAIIALAHSLDLSVVAEGVETEAQWTFVRDRGCDECQGYLFGRPVPVSDFTKILRGDKRRLA